MDDSAISYGFSANQGGGDVPGTFHSSHYSYGSRFIGKKIITDLSVDISGREKRTALVLSEIQPDLKLPEAKLEWEKLPKKYKAYQSGYEFRRINADRDVIPESESSDEFVEFNGNGATNLLRKFINHGLYDEKLVEETLLNELNSIMAPESHFKSIRV